MDARGGGPDLRQVARSVEGDGQAGDSGLGQGARSPGERQEGRAGAGRLRPPTAARRRGGPARPRGNATRRGGPGARSRERERARRSRCCSAAAAGSRRGDVRRARSGRSGTAPPWARLPPRSGAAGSRERRRRPASPPPGHSTVSLTTRGLGPRPKSSSFECWERKPEPAVSRPWPLLSMIGPLNMV